MRQQNGHRLIALTTRAFRLKAATLPNLPPGAWDIELDESEVAAPRVETFGLPFSPLGWPMNPELNLAESVLGLAFPFSSEEFHELGILIAARSWNSPVPWGAHVLSAVGSGIDPQAARAIGLREDASPFLTEEQLALYPHHGFFMSMDTYRDFLQLNEMVEAGQTPWIRDG